MPSGCSIDLVAISFRSKQIPFKWTRVSLSEQGTENGEMFCFMCFLCTSAQPFKSLVLSPATTDCHGLQNLPERRETACGLGSAPNESTISGASKMIFSFDLSSCSHGQSGTEGELCPTLLLPGDKATRLN